MTRGVPADANHYLGPALVLAAAVAAMSVAPDSALAQGVDVNAALAFEVASVRPSAPGQQGSSARRLPGGRATITNMPVRDIVRFIYQVQEFQIDGVPGWAANERYDIVAKAPGDEPPVRPGAPDPMIQMLRRLVEERFRIVSHRETRELPIYALVVARPGSLGRDLHPSTTDCLALANRAAEAARAGAAAPSFNGPDGSPLCGTRVGPGVVAAGGIGMPQFAITLSRLVDRAVVDRTGVTGAFDLQVRYTPDASQLPPGNAPPGSPPPAFDANGPSLFTALQEQLGLKLESTRGPVEVVVIDRLERPMPD
jgi:uncharacterized protein (TIGR03435 family)